MADRPVLGVEEAADLGALEQGDHRASSAPGRGARPEVRQGDVTDPPAAAATAGTAWGRGDGEATGLGIGWDLLAVARAHGRWRRRGDNAASRVPGGSLMRHILTPGPIPGLPRGVAAAAGPAVLIAAAGGVERGPAGPVGAAPRAVPIAAIAAAAEEEDVAAVGAGADHESERVHRSSRARREGMDMREEMCELWSPGLAESRPSRFGPRVRRGRALRALTLWRPGGNGLTLRQPAQATSLPAFAVRCPESRALR